MTLPLHTLILEGAKPVLDAAADRAADPEAWIDRAEPPVDERHAPEILAVSVFDAGDERARSSADGPAGRRRLELLLSGPAPATPEAVLSETGALIRALGLAGSAVSVRLAPVADQDWVATSLEGLAPVDVGPFRVRGAHHTRRPGAVDLLIEAGQAFGTGHHATTAGCLEAWAAMRRRAPRPNTPLRVWDVGAGTGLLAIAAAKTTPPGSDMIWATDVDPVAVTTARENITANGVGGRVRAIEANGVAHIALRGRQFDVAFANILAGPLVRLAPGLTRAAAPGASLILSGLLTPQARMVRAAYAARGWRLTQAFPRGEWTTLAMTRPAPGRRRPPPGELSRA